MFSASAFVPGHISGFFQVCDDARKPERIGSRNCGPCTKAGVLTQVKIRRGKHQKISVAINGKIAPDAITSMTAAKMVARMFNEPIEINIEHFCGVPIGAGYGASGAGALGVTMALSKALDLPHSRDKLVSIAHIAEVKCRTGLGDVGAQARGGFVIGLRPGAPPYGWWASIETREDIKIVCGTLGAISTRKLLQDEEFRKKSKKLGALAMKKLLKTPTLKNFISVSQEFAESLGLLDDELRSLIKAASSAGAIGASQAMLGRSIFAFVREKKLDEVKKAFLELLQPEAIVVTPVDNIGAKILL